MNPPRPLNKTSAFLKNYTPKQVVDSFKSTENGSGWGESNGGSQIVHNRQFQSTFAIQVADRVPLMVALKNDVDSQLAFYGASVLSQSGDPDSGYLFNYRLDGNTGSLTLSPLVLNHGIQRRLPLSAGIADVMFSVNIAENAGTQ